MTKVFITGATGNVGREVLSSLQKMNHQLELYTGVKDINVDRIEINNSEVKLIRFDFTDFSSVKQATLKRRRD
jgi:nucleoside-diphosphate-sugar epimerase